MYSRNKRSQSSSKKLLHFFHGDVKCSSNFECYSLAAMWLFFIAKWCGQWQTSKLHEVSFVNVFVNLYFYWWQIYNKNWLNLNEVKLEALIDNIQQIIFFLDYHYIKGWGCKSERDKRSIMDWSRGLFSVSLLETFPFTLIVTFFFKSLPCFSWTHK